jgi:predicted RNA-binding protein with PIN domain
VEVVYSPGHQSADTVIERFVHQSSKRGDIIVVTGDRGIRDLCRGLGALVMAPESFLKQVDERIDQARASLRRQAERHTGNPVEERLTGRSLTRLRRHSDRLKGKRAR